MTTALTTSQRVTLLKIDDGLAMTHRHELEVRRVLTAERVGYESRYLRVAVVRRRGRRKDVYLDLAADDILLDGWGLPFCADTEAGGVMAGNACYNLVGDPNEIRQAIETRAVYPVTDGAKAKVLVSRSARTKCDDSEVELLYPDIDTRHAVINDLKADRAPSPAA